MDKENTNNNANKIPVIQVNDPFEFVSGNTVIVHFKINRKNKTLVREFRLVRTKNDGYMMQ